MKNKNEIENYDYKAEVLRKNGWKTWYHDDNWIRTEWYNDPTIRIDYAGISTNIAYYQYSPEKEQEDLDAINNIRNVVKQYKKSINNKNSNGTEPIEID